MTNFINKFWAPAVAPPVIPASHPTQVDHKPSNVTKVTIQCSRIQDVLHDLSPSSSSTSLSSMTESSPEMSTPITSRPVSPFILDKFVSESYTTSLTYRLPFLSHLGFDKSLLQVNSSLCRLPLPSRPHPTLTTSSPNQSTVFEPISTPSLPLSLYRPHLHTSSLHLSHPLSDAAKAPNWPTRLTLADYLLSNLKGKSRPWPMPKFTKFPSISKKSTRTLSRLLFQVSERIRPS